MIFEDMKPNTENQWEMLSFAILIGTYTFRNKHDRGGYPYVLHMYYVMNHIDKNDAELMIIAFLHDLCEDFEEWTIDRLRALGFSERVCMGLGIMTHNPDDDYLKVYIPRIATNFDALRVKMVDLDHNSKPFRLKDTRKKDFDRITKYFKAYNILKTERSKR